MKILILLLPFLIACGADTDKDKCFGSGGAHYVMDASGQGQCVYDTPNPGAKK